MKKYFLPFFVLLVGSNITNRVFAQNTLDNLKLVTSSEVYFESTKHNISDEGAEQLNQVASQYLENISRKIRITAHTDAQGSKQSNYILSDKRANAVKYHLLSKGVPQEAIVIATFGADKPVADDNSDAGRKRNRRATVEIYDPAPEKVTVVEKKVMVEVPVSKVVEVPAKTVVEMPKSPVEMPAKTMEQPEIAMPYLSGVVRNSESGATVPALVLIHRLNGKVDSVMTDNNGVFKTLCTDNEPVMMDVFAKGFFYSTQDAIVTRGATPQKVEMQPIKVGSKAAINNLYFEGDAATLLKKSDPELSKLLRFMQLNEGLKVEIAGHVNAPGVEPSKLPKNEFDLSNSRAVTIRNFLISNGVVGNNISAKGYGNSEMRFPEPSNERQEELNRRVEIRVLGTN